MKKYIIRFIANLPALGVGILCLVAVVLLHEDFNWVLKLIILLSLISSLIGFAILVWQIDKIKKEFEVFINRLIFDYYEES